MSNEAGRHGGEPRIAMVGMPCAETAATLEALVQAGLPPAALLLSGDEPTLASQPKPLAGRLPTLPVLSPGDPAAVARPAGVPVVWLGEKPRTARARLAAELHGLDADVAIVACFPWRLPADVRSLPRWGVLNVHPSLLPRWRGPEPVFWTFHAGDAETGVTVHRMDDGFDAGPILAQFHVPIPEEAQLPDFERYLMRIGGELAARVVRDLAAGSAPERPQPTEGATYAPNPSAEDWVIRANWTVRRAYRFAKAVLPLGGPLAIETPEGPKRIYRVLAPPSRDAAGTSEPHSKRPGPVPGTRFVPLADGSLKVILGAW